MAIRLMSVFLAHLIYDEKTTTTFFCHFEDITRRNASHDTNMLQ